MKRLTLISIITSLAVPMLSCGGGVPVRLRIDEFTLEISLDDIVDEAFGELQNSGLLPGGTVQLPELWPKSLPSVQYNTLLNTPSIPVDLTPAPDDPDFDKYQAINEAEGAINRIELNRLIMRVEASTLTIDLPELRLQVADSPDADPNDRLSWRTIGTIPSAPAGFVGDLELVFAPSGETYLNSQFSDDLKEFALRAQGKIAVDTDLNPRLPSGTAVVRLIVVATFFVDPQGALDAAQNLGGGGVGGGAGAGGAGGGGNP